MDDMAKSKPMLWHRSVSTRAVRVHRVDGDDKAMQSRTDGIRTSQSECNVADVCQNKQQWSQR